MWAGAFSSFIVNALVGGTLLADGLKLGSDLGTPWAKGLASGVMLLGTIVAIVFGGNPVGFIQVAQGVTILGVPLIAVTMVLLARDRELMGDLRMKALALGISVIAIVWLLYLSGHRLYTFVF